MTSGTTIWRSTSTKRRPGRGSSLAINAMASRSCSSRAPHRLVSLRRSRRASRSMGCAQMACASSSRFICASVVPSSSAVRIRSRSCSCRHSARSRAPTPTGSRLCSSFRAITKCCSSSSRSSRSSPARLCASSCRESSR
ncbi:hypothetical protein SDC9_198120 [bioreactor metagenome]|uniref:Uncharacterized protein n=1 Tax=bioreactor metagenome TaxID=1076179 RepID=A0A645ITL0_9ZZZZ